MSATLIHVVDEHLRGCLPDGVPPSYRAIVSARKIRNDDGKSAIEANLVMFDGEAAKVVLTEHQPKRGAPAPFDFSIWSHRFLMPSAVYWEDGAWHREYVDLFGEIAA